MTWRNWSFIVVLLLLNYIVFSVLGSYIFIPSTETTPTSTPQPTFTPGARALTQVAPLPYTFLTPSPVAGATRLGVTNTPVALPSVTASRAP